MATDARLAEVLRAAQREGVLSAEATVLPQDARPWPVVLLTALGAWLAVIPLVGVVGMLFHKLLEQSGGMYLVAALLLVGSSVVLRGRGVPIFVEQLALPGLLVGGGTLAAALYQDVSKQGAAAMMCTVSLALAFVLPKQWLRVLLGAAAAGFLLATVLPERLFSSGAGMLVSVWFALHYALVPWVAAMLLEKRLRAAPHARYAAVLDGTAAGWVLVVLASLAAWSGMTFLVDGALGGGIGADLLRVLLPNRPLEQWLLRIVSCGCAIAGAGLLARAWPSLRTPGAAGVAVVVVLLCGLMPALGAVLLALACCATTQRWRLAAASAVAAAWIVGAFYYQLDWPLGTKAAVLVGAAAVLAGISWWATGRRASVAIGHAPAPAMRGAMLVAASAIATLAVANYAIVDKESLIASGRKVYVALAPVDPRSLMQGDYMRLNYRLPGDVENQGTEILMARPFVVMKVDARGVAQPLRIVHSRVQPGADEVLVELSPKEGRWLLVSDAWYFTEGDGERWNAARYGEFRVTPDGRALLVGLADEKLATIREKP